VLIRLKRVAIKDDQSFQLIDTLAYLLSKQDFRAEFFRLKAFPAKISRALDIEGRSCLGPLLRLCSMGYNAGRNE
jgi:hypothetical protein